MNPHAPPQPAAGQLAGWPPAVFDAPVLRDLDEPSRRRICVAGKLLALPPGGVVYREGDVGHTFFVVASGEVALVATPRGHDQPTVVRTAQQGDTFGEEATLPGGLRRTTATAQSHTQVAEIPVAVYRRAAVRSGVEALADREQRILRRRATADLLATMSFTRELPPDELGILMDAVEYRTLERGERIYGVGDVSDAFFMIVSGIVQLQTEHDDRLHVRAYLSPGDFFGDEELLGGQRRPVNAVAMGQCQVLRLPEPVFRTLVDRNPGLLPRIRRISSERHALQADVVGRAAAHSTRHVFRDLYRMQMATSLLTIDQDLCVRCGHCAWSCEAVYGIARLTRRGDKIVTSLADGGSTGEPKSLLLPNSCQHCKNPVCMIDCPTGAIGRDPEGEVFIREQLCTGCGSCAKSCPWENIKMAPRPKGSQVAQSLRISAKGRGASVEKAFPEVAVKCDLCRAYEGPACVQACPTGAIVRLDPLQDFGEVARLLSPRAGGRTRPSGGRILGTLAVMASATVALAAAIVGMHMHGVGAWYPAAGYAYAAGWVAGTGMFLLAAYTVPKRLVHLWMRARKKLSAARRMVEAEAGGPRANETRSKVRPFYVVHLAIGFVTLAAVSVHAGPRLPGNVAGALGTTFWVTALVGLFGGLAYRAIPSRLTRLERNGALPEDLKREREHLVDRLHRAVSGRSDVVKSITDKILVAYANAPFGPLALLLSGRGLTREQRRLRKRVDALLQGRGQGKLGGLDEIIEIVVEMRALPARRLLTGGLRAWLPVHIVLTGIVLALTVIHIVATTVLA